MKAMIINQFGPAKKVFELVEIAVPVLKANEVLIRVHATSVNPLDCKIRSGDLGALAPAFPAILHGDVAGKIEKVGKAVTQFKPGDAVYGNAGGVAGMGGALGEYLVADADLLAHKPRKLTMLEAAALPLVSLTAWEGLIRLANIQPGQTVLIHGGTGGVGHIAIQLAKWRDAIVHTTCSNDDKTAVAKRLGADHVINYKQESVSDYVEKYTDNRGFDVVFDTVGGQTLDHSLQAAAINGQVVTILAVEKHDLTPLFLKGLSLHAVFQPNPLLTGNGRAAYGDILHQIATLADTGQLHPVLDHLSFSVTDIGLAHEHLESGTAIGKVVLVSNLGK